MTQEKQKIRKNIDYKMFDIKPSAQTRGGDVEKNIKLRKVVRVLQKEPSLKVRPGRERHLVFDVREPNEIDLEKRRFNRYVFREREQKERERLEKLKNVDLPVFVLDEELGEPFNVDVDVSVKKNPKKSCSEKEKKKISLFPIKKTLVSFSFSALVVFLVVSQLGFINFAFSLKNSALSGGQKAFANLAEAKEGIKEKDFQKSSYEFQEAYDRFSEISNDMEKFNSVIIETSRFMPYLSKLSSGSALAKSGKNVSKIGVVATEMLSELEALKDSAKAEQQISLLAVFENSDRKIKEIAVLLQETENELAKVNLDDVPADQRERFSEMRSKLPEINVFLDGFIKEGKIFTDVLGGNGPRKYLFLFQNNQEMRPTGGFVGSYGVLEISNGHVRNFFIDGIFNPDGQLREKVVPPAPIQKISAAWSLHDSNWFPDFPVSAEKACWFYEKTGGPTVDGVITMTPTVMQKLLEITGPIDMPDYGVTIDKDNFVEKVQYEVEVDYDKEENRPKKILSDLAPLILDRLVSSSRLSNIAKTLGVLVDSLDEKHILIYSKNYEIQKILSERGWTGEVLETGKDYLSVINTNINGYKTDGVVEESINHQAEIQSDGSIIDTVTITRHHNGGNSSYEWWNKVNADYMRVYVPKGALLLSAEGHTREFNSPPLDYDALKFKRDPQVLMEEASIEVDEKTGTRIYEDAGKTVFANWAYVSPQETVTVKYTYLLPFKFDLNFKDESIETYSLLVQKQSGSLGSRLSHKFQYPKDLRTVWAYPEEKVEKINESPEGKEILHLENDLAKDRFFGVALGNQ